MSYDIEVAGYDFNYTYNQHEFFTTYGVHPYDDLGGRSAGVVAEKIDRAIERIYVTDIRTLNGFDSANGWGSWHGATDWLMRIRAVCRENPDEIVEAS